MLNSVRLISSSRNLIKLFKVSNRTEITLNQSSCLNRILLKLNSGCLIAGCCFSRHPDEESLLHNEKDNSDVLENQQIHNSPTHYSSHDQNESISSNMKRISEANADVPLSDSASKKKKTDDEDDIVHERQSCTVSSVPEDEALHKTKQEIPDVKIPAAESKKPKKLRPNYFVAIKVSDAQIHQTLNELQQHMLEKDERLKESLIPLPTLHITLMVMHIGDTETHARAMKTLENIHREHDEDLSKYPLNLEFKGLGHFQNRVLFAKLLADDSSDRLSLLADSVKQHFDVAAISSTDTKKDFTPHLTVAKIRENFHKKKKLPKKINPSTYKEFSDQYFGSQTVQSIQLLSMTGPKDEVGYYSGNEIYFSAFQPKDKQESFNKLLSETQERKKNVRDMISALMQEKLNNNVSKS